MAVRRLVRGEVAQRGVLIPVQPALYEPILDELAAEYGIRFQEEEGMYEAFGSAAGHYVLGGAVKALATQLTADTVGRGGSWVPGVPLAGKGRIGAALALCALRVRVVERLVVDFSPRADKQVHVDTTAPGKTPPAAPGMLPSIPPHPSPSEWSVPFPTLPALPAETR